MSEKSDDWHGSFMTALVSRWQRLGFRVQTAPRLRGGKRADLAVRLPEVKIYFEIKTSEGISKRVPSARRRFRRELLRSFCHAVTQLPRNQSSVVMVRTAPVSTSQEARLRLAQARNSLEYDRMRPYRNLLGLMIFVPTKHDVLRYRMPRSKIFLQNPWYRGRLRSAGHLLHL